MQFASQQIAWNAGIPTTTYGTLAALASIKSFLEMQKISLEKNKNLTEKFLNKK
jgi:hypothetical protein